MRFAAGQCVGYQESFAAGDGAAGAYVCALTITSDGLVLTPGGPAAHARPALAVPGGPHEALLGPWVVPQLTAAPVAEAVTESVAETAVEAVAEAAVEAVAELTLAEVLGPAALVLGLILGAAPPAGGPGIPHVPPVGRDELRLRELEAKHANGTLAAGEEAELVALLAKVKGLHVHNLSEIDPAKKPKYAPVIGKWIAKKGRIDVLPNGDWRYTDWEGNAVVYQGDEPNFDKYARQQVDITDMKGDCTTDFTKADADAPLGAKLPGNIWHHKQNTKTMQEVPRDIHERFTHYGARHVLKNQANLTQTNPAPTIGKRVLRKK